MSGSNQRAVVDFGRANAHVGWKNVWGRWPRMRKDARWASSDKLVDGHDRVEGRRNEAVMVGGYSGNRRDAKMVWLMQGL